jgi:hypothetical protein
MFSFSLFKLFLGRISFNFRRGFIMCFVSGIVRMHRFKIGLKDTIQKMPKDVGRGFILFHCFLFNNIFRNLRGN